MMIETQFDRLEIPDFMMNGRWEITILRPTIDTTTLITTMGNTFIDFGDINAYTNEVSIPQEKLKYEKTSFNYINFDGEDEYGDVTIKYFDDIKLSLSSKFQKWLDSVWNKEKRVLRSNWRSQYRDIIVRLRNPLYGQKYSKSYKLCRCYPIGIDDLDLGNDSEVMEFSFNLVCERVITI